MPEDFNFEEENHFDSAFFGQHEDREGRSDNGGSVEEKEVKVVGVYEHRADDNPQPTAFVLLRDDADRSVPIFIGKFEAMSIWLAIEGTSADRPLTHDLLNNIVARMGGTVERILIDDFWNSTYYAKVTINYNGKTMDVDARPSDGIALALRAKAPIFIAESVIVKAAVKEE